MLTLLSYAYRLLVGCVHCQKTQPPWEFLLSASRTSLQSYELSRLGHAANLRKEITALLDQWLEENASAMLARWLMEQRERPSQVPEPVSAGDTPLKSGHAVSDNFFADRGGFSAANRGPSRGDVYFSRTLTQFAAEFATGGVAGTLARRCVPRPGPSCSQSPRPSAPLAVSAHPRPAHFFVNQQAHHSPVSKTQLRLGCFIFIRGHEHTKTCGYVPSPVPPNLGGENESDRS